MSTLINPRNNYTRSVLSVVKIGAELLRSLLSVYTTVTVPLGAVHPLCSAPDCVALPNTTNLTRDRRRGFGDQISFRISRREGFYPTCITPDSCWGEGKVLDRNQGVCCLGVETVQADDGVAPLYRLNCTVWFVSITVFAFGVFNIEPDGFRLSRA